MPVLTYDPRNIVVNIGGAIITGFADGTFVAVERNEDMFKKVSGADGITSRAKQNDGSWTLTMTLAQTSPSNDILSAFALKDEFSNKGVVPVLIKDIGGTTNIASAFAWVRKLPKVEYGKEITNREWILDLADVIMRIGGNVAATV